MTIRGAQLSVLLGILTLSSVGCAPPGIDEDDEVSESSDEGSVALGDSLLCDASNLGAKACKDALDSARFQAYLTGRSDILERGITWLTSGVTYNANAYYQGYRRDCSGFVSMAWQYTANPGTIWFPPFNYSNQYAFELGSLEELVPGDALNRKTRKKNSAGNLVGHVMLFAGWASFDHNELFVLHEYSTGKPAALIRTTRAELADYLPIRAVNAPAPAAPSPTPTTPEPDPTPAPDPEPGCGKLLPNESLGVNEALTSCDGRFSLVLQGDGNLVLYQAGGKALWQTKTVGTPAQIAVMQGDGNFVMYGPSAPIWWTHTDGNPGGWLSLDDHGALILFDANEKPIWWDGTGGL